MLCAPADETSVSAPVAVTRSNTVVALLVVVSRLVVFVVSKEVSNAVVVSAVVVSEVPRAVSKVVVVVLLVPNVVVVERLVLKYSTVDRLVLKDVVKLVVTEEALRRIW